MSVKPLGAVDDPSKGPPLGRAQVMKEVDFEAITKSSDSMTNSLTTTDLNSKIYKKQSVNSDSEKQKSAEQISDDQKSVPDG